jgi:hypothetical protein
MTTRMRLIWAALAAAAMMAAVAVTPTVVAGISASAID